MNKTGLLHDLRFMLHDTGPYHPEMAERVKVIHDGLTADGIMAQLTTIPVLRADLKWIQAVHQQEYIRRFEEVCLAGKKIFGYSDNQMCTETYETALNAVGGIIEAARMLMAGDIDNAFCIVRPPGHHAEEGEAMGFCYFNNIAIAARYLQTQWQIERVGIIDFDVHHGNGTQHIFEKDPTVFYYSIHQHPSFAFPGTGREFEQGSGDGFGFTKNSPVLPGKGDEDYMHLMERDLFPAFEMFQPQVILVSAGFDAHEDDEMSDINLTTECFSWIMERIMEMAQRYADGRLISILEGGYALHRLPELVKNHITILLNG
jgi:acetoin utilization deacetylase AcuC-like enzyme